jgi:hypothetical protein
MHKTKKVKRKIKSIRLKNKKLCKRYPFLIPKSTWDGKVAKDYDYSYTEYDWIEPGWRIGFGKFWLEDLRAALVKTGHLHDFYFEDLKEKYGRFVQFPNIAPQEVYDVIDKYEYISQYICYVCGNPYAGLVNCYGLIEPMCKKCWDKNNKRLEKLGIKIKSYEEVADKRVGLPDKYHIRKWCKNGKENIEIDISDVSEKIQKAYEKRIRKKG